MQPTPDPGFFQALPKADLHRHLHGSIRPAVYEGLIRKYGFQSVWQGFPASFRERVAGYPFWREFLKSPMALSDIACLQRRRAADFGEFASVFCVLNYFVRELEDYELVLEDLAGQLRDEGVVYGELIIMASALATGPFTLLEFFERLNRARASILERDGIEINWIFDFIRDWGPEKALENARRLVEARVSNLVGVTLGGSEALFPPALFRAVFDFLRENSRLGVAVHAGEGTHPGSVRDAVVLLGSNRIGHGVSAAADPSLLDLLAARGIPIEICPGSNLRTGVLDSPREHPFRLFEKHGLEQIPCTDDPQFFETNLPDEYLGLAEHFGLDPRGALRLAANSFRHAFCSEAAKSRHLARLEAFSSPLRGTSLW